MKAVGLLVALTVYEFAPVVITTKWKDLFEGLYYKPMNSFKIDNGRDNPYETLENTEDIKVLDEDLCGQFERKESPPFVTIRAQNLKNPLETFIVAHGEFAGYQLSIPNNDDPPYADWKNTWFTRFPRESGWTQTVYFINPDKICDKELGEKEERGIYIKYGETALKVPLEIKEGDTSVDGWTIGKFVTYRGIHAYMWHPRTESTRSCKYFVPVMPIYDQSSRALSGFVLVRPLGANENVEEDNRENFLLAFNDAPECFNRDRKWARIRTQYVSFHPRPDSIRFRATVSSKTARISN